MCRNAQKVSAEAINAGVQLHPLLHDGIETMGKNERATFVVTITDGRESGLDEGVTQAEDGDDEPQQQQQPRRLEYDLSLDGWTEEV